MISDEIIIENAKIIDLKIKMNEDLLCCRLTFEFSDTEQSTTVLSTTVLNTMKSPDKVSICELLQSLMFYTHVESLDKIFYRVVRIKHSYCKIYEIGHPLKDDWIKV